MIATQMPEGSETSNVGRPIAAIPLAHLLLMPRSLLVLSSSLYASHLHGIAERSTDVVVAEPSQVEAAPNSVVVANSGLIGDATIADALKDSGKWEAFREVRTSLTFRHANKVLKGGALALAHGGLRRA